MTSQKPAQEPISVNHRKSGEQVLRTEASAIMQLADSLNGDFSQAVATLLACRGRVVVSGMGKSGHVANKIAATMASTGTPAFFVHPAEASHGDLGMIQRDDVVLALSNSGETAELTDLVAYTRRFSIPLIAITSRAQSALATAADTALILPPCPEACPNGLAPTTSTTLMLALGDALAVAVLESKGFSADDFRNFHPGGKLGKTLLRISELMHSGDALPLCAATDKMRTVLVTMTAKSFGCAGVINAEGDLIGVITDGDLRRHLAGDILDQSAQDIMTSNPFTIPPTMLAAEAIKHLNETKRTNVFVIEGRKPVGILHIHDLLRAGLA